MTEQSRRMAPLAAISLALAANAASASVGPCKGRQDPGPCTVPQSAPFKNIKLKPGMNVHALDKYVVVSWVGPAQKVEVDSLDLRDPLPLMADDLWQVVIRYHAAPRFKSDVYFNVTRRDGATLWKSGHFYGPQAARTSEVKATPGESMGFPDNVPGVQVWLPPGYQQGRSYPIVYVADSGGNRGALAAAGMRKGDIAPVIVVGVDACAKVGADPDCRGQHYIDKPEEHLGLSAERFDAYEKFFIHTVVPQVEARYGAPADRSQRAVTGYSNGGAWAASMALRNPGLFGRAIAMSPAGDMFARIAPKTDTFFALSGGEFEPAFSRHAQCFASALAGVDGKVSLRLYPAGHSPLMWEEEFMAAMKDWLGTPRQPPMPVPPRPAWCPPLDKA